MIVIIGASGHGKSTLAKAIEQLSNVKCEVLNTQDLFEIIKEQKKTLEDLQKELTYEIKVQSIKRKEEKNWKRTKFYQR